MAQESKQFGGAASGAASELQHQQGQQDPMARAGEGTAKMRSALKEAGGEVAKIARERTHEMRKMVEEQTEAMAEWVKARPFTSVLIGAAVGYLLGRMSRR